MWNQRTPKFLTEKPDQGYLSHQLGSRKLNTKSLDDRMDSIICKAKSYGEPSLGHFFGRWIENITLYVYGHSDNIEKPGADVHLMTELQIVEYTWENDYGIHGPHRREVTAYLWLDTENEWFIDDNKKPYMSINGMDAFQAAYDLMEI
jgi:hypothetical protein